MGKHMNQTIYDVAIIGGGPAGCATAIALKKQGIEQILVAEAGSYQQPRIGESIPPDTRDLFAQLGIWEAFVQQHHEPCMGSQSSWGADALGYNDFLFNPKGTGWHLDRLRFDQFMAEQAKQSHIDFIPECPFKSIRHQAHNNSYELTFKDGKTITCRFVVDASGRGAKVARRLGAQRKEADALLFVSAYIPLSEITSTRKLNRMTYLEAVEYGWWYAARLPDEHMVFAAASTPQIIEAMQLQKETTWRDALLQTQHLSQLFAQPLSLPVLNSWLAPSALLDPPAGAGWLAVGDAASTFDPISSQGIYKALQHSLNAAPAIVDWLAGKQQTLLDYRQYVGNQFIEYLEQRDYFYQMEQRWWDSEFWSARRAV